MSWNLPTRLPIFDNRPAGADSGRDTKTSQRVDQRQVCAPAWTNDTPIMKAQAPGRVDGHRLKGLHGRQATAQVD